MEGTVQKEGQYPVQDGKIWTAETLLPQSKKVINSLREQLQSELTSELPKLKARWMGFVNTLRTISRRIENCCRRNPIDEF